MQQNLTHLRRLPQPSVEAPPTEADLWRSLALYFRLRSELPHITPECCWDLARSSTWSHWRREVAA